MGRRQLGTIGAVISLWTGIELASADAPPLQQELKDANAEGTKTWIYNDINAGIAEARRQNKPLFVTFRCVPCKNCASFDAEVASGNDRISQLAQEKFVSVRQVEMKGVDLNLFQFDHDLNWAAMFIHPDGVVYARYGTQSAVGPDAYNSIAGLESTMRRVLDLHAKYPSNQAQLKDKRPAKKPFQTALEMPGIDDRLRNSDPTTRKNCIHCHNIHDAEQKFAQRTGTFTIDMMYRYPLPDNIGLSIDPVDGVKIKAITPGSPAAAAGLQVGESIVQMNGQAITSIADMQWVLHPLPNQAAEVTVLGSLSGAKMVALKPGWKESDFSWRGSMWSLAPKFSVWIQSLEAAQRSELKLNDAGGAYRVRWINTGAKEGKAVEAAGLQKEDVIVRFNGQPVDLQERQFHMNLKKNFKVGDTIQLTILRNGKSQELTIPLVD